MGTLSELWLYGIRSNESRGRPFMVNCDWIQRTFIAASILNARLSGTRWMADICWRSSLEGNASSQRNAPFAYMHHILTFLQHNILFILVQMPGTQGESAALRHCMFMVPGGFCCAGRYVCCHTNCRGMFVPISSQQNVPCEWNYVTLCENYFGWLFLWNYCLPCWGCSSYKGIHVSL